jgi:hypothetical protein
MRTTLRSLAAASILAAVAGCSGISGPGGDQLTPEEAQFLANQMAAASLEGLSEGMGSMPAPPSGPPDDGFPGNGVISWNRSFEITRECPAGGTMTVAGETHGEIDRETRSGTITSSHRLNLLECAHQRDSITITVTTDPPITMEGTITFAQGERATGEFTKSGVFFWEASDGRSGSCEVNLTVTWDGGNHGIGRHGWGHGFRGTMCGKEIRQAGNG